MNSSPAHWVVVLVVTLYISSTAFGQTEPAKPQTTEPKAPASDLFGLEGAAKAAGDLRQAGDSFDRVANVLKDLVPPVMDSLAEMSRGFDPFGYKAAFQTIAQQNETIQRQQETIQELLRADIARLQRELDASKQVGRPAKATKPRKPK